MNMKQNYKNDKLGEEVVHDFLCKNFYNLSKRNCKSTLYSKKCQEKGVDEIIDGFCIDEKAAIEWATPKNIKNSLSTFTVELYTKNNSSHDHYGWFIDNRKSTDYYFFMWIWVDLIKRKDELKYKKFIRDSWWEKEQIDKICLYVINRKKLRDKISQVYSENKKEFNYAFEKIKVGKDDKVKVNDDIAFIHSKNQISNSDAINLQLKKDFLGQVAEYKGEVLNKVK